MQYSLIDTHAHLDEDAFADDREQVVERAREASLEAVVTIGTTADSSRSAVELASQHELLYAAVGIQPNYVSEAQPGDWETIEQLVTDPKVVAVGETGLDRYWDFAPFDLQSEYFKRHIALARQHDLPFVVHMRDCEDDIVSHLRDAAQNGPLQGVMHSFTGSVATVQACLEMGMYVSFAGMVTFKKNDDLRKVVAEVPFDRVLVETDAPYLAPVPKRGKRNEPAYVAHTAECLAGVYGVSLSEMANATTENARRLFGLPT